MFTHVGVFGKLKIQVLAMKNAIISTTWLFHKSSLFSPTVSVKNDEIGVVYDSIQDSDSEFFIKQEVLPMAKLHIRCYDEAFLLVAFSDYFKEKACAFLMKRQIAPFIQND